LLEIFVSIRRRESQGSAWPFESEGEIPYPMYAQFLLVMLLAINGQEEIRKQAGHDLRHKAIRAAGQTVIYLEVLFPRSLHLRT
jgi:hypothetical protein